MTGANALLLWTTKHARDTNLTLGIGVFKFNKYRTITIPAESVTEDLYDFPVIVLIEELQNYTGDYQFYTTSMQPLNGDRRDNKTFVCKVNLSSTTDTEVILYYE